jgi:beta-glucosidase/6-phospho-beta-glucosidase/beta-galactosidase
VIGAKATLFLFPICPAADDGKVYDTDRIMFLRVYLTQLQRATADGVPVKGYFQWSTMDNFEWIAEFGNHFGLVYVDFKTQKRTLKMSATWFREVPAAMRSCRPWSKEYGARPSISLLWPVKFDS